MLSSYLSIPLHTAEKKEITPFRSYIFYCKIFKRALLFLRYCITLCPNEETLSLHIVIVMYRYGFDHMCIVIALYRYCYRKIGSVIASLSYRLWNIGTVIAIISYFSGNIRSVIAS
jgi:hypothetical protein